MFRLLSGIILSAALVSPSLLAAHGRQDRDDHQRSEQRHDDRDHRENNGRPYYDSAHRDWHQWNSDEDREYHSYAGQHHWNQDFGKLNEKQQDEYWKWRHKHSNSR